MIAPVYAAPSLSLGATASYSLTGKIQATQSCTATPLAYASQACLGYSPPSPNYFVSIISQNNCANAVECSFLPASLTVTEGSTVTWTNNGNVTHSIVANATANVGLPSFSSGTLYSGWSFGHFFNQTGTYYYYDPAYNFMKGVIIVGPAPPPPPPPAPTTVQVDLSGNVGWTVEGLSSSQANLLVSHNIAVSVSPIPLVSFTPVTESGSFEQSINLATRVESPGTATSLVKSMLGSILEGLYPTTYTGYPGTLFETMLSSQSNGPNYTQWWVNGPLSKGSPVQILNGWSSVTGSESLNLGAGIGTRSAWIVTSQLSQSVNVTIPNVSNPLSQSSVSNAAANLKLLWSYDQSADLLLRNDNAVGLSMHSVTPTTIYVPTSCGPYTCYGPISVTVTRDTTATIDIALLLSSTSLSLPKSPSHTASLMDVLSAIPWMPFGLAGLAAGAIIGLVFWLTRKNPGTVLPGPTPVPTASPPSAPPS